MKYSISTLVARFLAVAILASFTAVPSFAHCDTMNGPVVKAAQKALETGDIKYVLVWVKKSDEKEIREAFEKTRAVRTLGGEAKSLADKYFFETLVRIHRAGEGAPYTGLKEAEAVEPGIAEAEEALAKSSPEELVEKLTHALHAKLGASFTKANSRKNYDPADVEAGREYVEAYVQYIHYVERVHNAIASEAAHGEGAPEHEH